VIVHFTRSAGLAERHIAEQYTAMLVRRVAEASGMHASPFRSIAFSSDPFGSLDSLRPWLGDELIVGDRPGLKMTLRDDVLDRPLPFREAGLAPLPPASWLPLGPAIGLREGLAQLLSTMLLGSVPTIVEVARVAGMSQRSLQRQLHAEGSSFREVLDAQRRELALSCVHRPRVSLGELSQSLGYGHQSSLTRAFRRWTDESPRQLRRERTDAVGEVTS
jgi:AraC-like DNA-binding protein